MLARSGLSVCVVDKDEFPSDTLSTHGIQPTGVQVLERLGVLDRILKVAPPVVRGRMIFDNHVAPIDDIVRVTGAPMVSARRVVLDEILVDTAAKAGVRVMTGTRVTGLVIDDGRVAGVETPAGTLRASLVVGADGTRSVVAKEAGAKEYQPTANGRIFMWAYYEGDPTNGEAWIGKIDDHAYLVMPTDAGLSLVGACPSVDRRDEVRRDREGVYEAGIRAWPELADALSGMRRDGSVLTMANLHGYFRESAGPGWVLVGDAGHFKDPTPGQGIADALRQAEKLAPAIEKALGGAKRPDDVLAEWWRWRDEDAWEMYWFAHDAGAAGPAPPFLSEAQREIAADPALTEALFRIFNHELRPSEVFTPAFSMRTLAKALRRQRGKRRAIVDEVATVAREEVRRRRTARRGFGRPPAGAPRG